MVRPFERSLKCMAPSKFHQTHNNAFCENRSRFDTGSATCSPRFNRCLCLSRLLKYIHFSSQVTIQSRMKRSSRGFSNSYWYVFTRFKSSFSVNSFWTSHHHLFTMPWTWRGFGQPMFRKYRVYSLICCVCWWMDSSFRLRWVWHQNARLVGKQEFHYARFSCRFLWTFKPILRCTDCSDPFAFNLACFIAAWPALNSCSQ